MPIAAKVHDKGIHENGPSQRRLRSKMVGGKVAKKSVCKTRKLVTKKSNTKSTVDNTATKSIHCKSSKKCFQVNTDGNSTMDSSMNTPPTLFIDEDIICDDGNNKNNTANESDTGMELSFNDKEKTNEPVYTTLNDVDFTPLSHASNVNGTEAFTTSNADHSTSDVSLDEGKIRQLLTDALSSTTIEVDQTARKQNTNGHQSRRYLNDCYASKSSFTQPIGQQFTPHMTRPTNLHFSSSAKSSAVRNLSTDRTRDSCLNQNFIPAARSQSVLTTGICTTPVHLANSKSTARSSVTFHHRSQLNNDRLDQIISNQVNQNMVLLQALPEYRSLEREVKLLKKRTKQWSHDYETLEGKFEELKTNSFPRPSADGYEFLLQLLDSLSCTRSDNDTRTNTDLASSLNLNLEQLVSLEHEDPQRTALNILHTLFPTNKDKADLVGIRQMVAMHGDILKTIYLFARRSSPNASFTIRQFRNTFGMAIRQARYRENLSNRNVLVLGEALMNTASDNNSSAIGVTKYNNTLRCNVNEVVPGLDVDSTSGSDDE